MSDNARLTGRRSAMMTVGRITQLTTDRGPSVRSEPWETVMRRPLIS